MISVLIPLKEAVITAEKDIKLHRLEVGVEKINITSFRLMPTTMGESDITKGVLLIPGVQSVGEGSAGFNVRGGSADQNLILLYGAPVYNSSHFFGFFSAVNPDIIKDVTLTRAGLREVWRKARIRADMPRDCNRESLPLIGISPITTHFIAEGPIKTDSVLYCAGRQFIQLGAWTEENPHSQEPGIILDLNVRIAFDINKNKNLIFQLITATIHSGLIQTQHTSIRIISLPCGGAIISAAVFSQHLHSTIVFISTIYQACGYPRRLLS
jgi:hypothetical protein